MSRPYPSRVSLLTAASILILAGQFEKLKIKMKNELKNMNEWIDEWKRSTVGGRAGGLGGRWEVVKWRRSCFAMRSWKWDPSFFFRVNDLTHCGCFYTHSSHLQLALQLSLFQRTTFDLTLIIFWLSTIYYHISLTYSNSPVNLVPVSFNPLPNYINSYQWHSFLLNTWIHFINYMT